MLIDELRESLKNIEPNIIAIKKFWQNSKSEEKFKELDNKINQEEFWQSKQQAQVLKEHQRLKTLRDKFKEIEYTDFYNVHIIVDGNENYVDHLGRYVGRYAKYNKRKA